MKKTAVYICTNAKFTHLGLMFHESFKRYSNITDEVDFIWYQDEESLGTIEIDNIDCRLGKTTQLDNYTEWDDDFFYGMSIKVFALQELYQVYDRVIYFDVDVIINSDLTGLLNIDLQGKSVGAVPDICFQRWDRIAADHVGSVLKHRDKLIGDYLDYVNTGMFVVDCTKNKQFPDYDELATEWQYCLVDQDYMNLAFIGDILMLPETYNYMVDLAFIDLFKPRRIIEQNGMQSISAVQHFHGSAKPWVLQGSDRDLRVLSAMSTNRFLEIYDYFKPLFHRVPELSWWYEAIERNRPLLERSDYLATALLNKNNSVF